MKSILFFLFSLSIKIIIPNKINTNLKNDKYFKKALSKSILSKGNIRIIKLKKKIIIFSLKILNFFNFLKLIIAYNEKINEKQFNANGPRIMKTGKDININLKIMFIFSFILDIIILI